MRITSASGLEADEVERMVTEADKFRTTDHLRRELAELRNQSETLLYTTEQALDGYADLVEATLLEQVKEQAALLRHLLDGAGDLPSIRDAYQQLETAAFGIAETLYGSGAVPADDTATAPPADGAQT
jgi:molecular chaperone DnaK